MLIFVWWRGFRNTPLFVIMYFLRLDAHTKVITTATINKVSNATPPIVAPIAVGTRLDFEEGTVKEGVIDGAM